MLVPTPGGLAPAPQRNPGSATGMIDLSLLDILTVMPTDMRPVN